MSADPPPTVVVTGASAGLGRAIALEFARHGARVALLARGEGRLRAACAELEAAGGEALMVPVDMADAEQVEAAAARVEEHFGPIDVWVNNAMATVFAPLEAITPADFRRATEVTYLGAVWGTMAALRRMRQRDRGVVVQVSSGLAYRAIPLQAPYCGAKHALRGFTDSARTELMHAGSRVHLTMVHMPALNTPQFDWARAFLPRRPRPVAPVFQPEVGARAVYRAAGLGRRDLFVGGPVLQAVWGNRLAPWLADRYLARTAIAGQQRPESLEGDREGNLWQSVAGDQNTHGSFGSEARGHSVQLWLTLHRGVVGATVAAGLVVLGVMLW